MDLISGEREPNVALRALEGEARHDLARLNFPAQNWVLPRKGPNDEPVLDALVVGGGMCGQTVGFALLREGIRNFRVIDRASPGREGPWATFARMDTLRSPKHLTGPDLGVASLTYRAWHEALHGSDGWTALYKIDRLDWLAYLLWVRRVVGVPIENDTALATLIPAGDYLEATLSGPRGTERVLARKVVLALGREGSGAPLWPHFPSFNPSSPITRRRVFHSADDIDFGALVGKRVGILGAGSSAFDNAGTALEAGAASVVMYARRAHLPQVNKAKWASFAGFQRGFVALPDDLRWRFFTYIFDEQVPPPFESVNRCDRHAAFTLRLSAPWTDLAVDADAVTVTTPGGTNRFDAVVIATGFDVDLLERPEIAALREYALLWRDRVSPEAARAHPAPARFPYLGDGFELLERLPGTVPRLADVHIFNWGATMSHGQLAGDIPGIATGVNRLAERLVRDLFVADAEQHWQGVLAHEDAELRPTRYYVPPNERL